MQALRVCAAGAAALACAAPTPDASEPSVRSIGQAAEGDSEWIHLVEFSPREGHTATLLPDGRVLVTGGADASGTLSTAEIFDATTGEHISVGSMSVPRAGHTATLLRNGKVLIVGGEAGDSPSGIAELFEPGDSSDNDPPHFVPIERLIEPRRKGHTATLLRRSNLGDSELDPSGSLVLIAGGCADPRQDPASSCLKPIPSIEVYDASTKRFKALSVELKYARARHRATLTVEQTGDEHVVFTGGVGIGDPDPVAEVLSGANGTLGELPMSVSHNAHTATLLHSRELLVAGNWVLSGGGARAEVIADSGTRVLDMLQSRSWHTATLLPYDEVLLVGGMSPEPPEYAPLSGVEAYSAMSDAFAARPSLHEARMFHSATLLADASLLVMGGSDLNRRPLKSAELLRPNRTSSTLIQGDPAGMQLTQTAAVRLADGRVLVTGGRETQPQRQAYLFVPGDTDESGAWQQISDMGAARAGHTATALPNGNVLIAGGISSESLADFAELYIPEAPNPGRFVRFASSSAARARHTATLLSDGNVLLVGGEDESGPLKTAELISATGETRLLDHELAMPRFGHTATRLVDGQLLIAGGSGDSSAELYDIGAKTFTPIGPMRHERSFHTATVLASGKVLIAGGRGPDGVARSDAELYDPGLRQFVDTRGPMTVARSDHTATLLVGGRVLLAGGDTQASTEVYDAVTDSFVPAAPTARARSSHAATMLADGSVLLVGGAMSGRGLLERWREDAGNAFQFRPLLNAVLTPSTLHPGRPAVLDGDKYTCMSEANGGSPNTAPTNHPIVIWMPNDGAASVGGALDWKPNSATWQVPRTPFPGPGLVFVVVNGMRSVALSAPIEVLESGEPCVSGGQCKSSYCADGVCCNEACAGECHQCSSGVCEAMADGQSDKQCGGGVCRKGSCDGTCRSTRDCDTGLVCGSNGMCTVPTLAADEGGAGCTCRAVEQRARIPWSLGAVAIACVWRRRRTRAQNTYAA